jgi:probable rRNA maturation factor
MQVDINNRSRQEIDETEISAFINFFSRKFKLNNKELSIAFVGDKKIRSLNRACRDKDKVTDILSFEGEDEFFGELVINFSRVKNQARFYSKDDKKELLFILAHGLLHLLGHEDDTEEKRKIMVASGEKILNEYYKNK